MFRKTIRLDDQAMADPQAGASMDKALPQRHAWRRLTFLLAMALLALGVITWLLLEHSKGNVYRLPLNRVTIAAVTTGPFEDYTAVRGAVAPLIIDYLTTDQGGTVKQVLVEDGAMVKRGEKLIILSNPALQLQVAAQQLAFEQTRFKYRHDLLDIEHQISKLKNDLARDKVLLDGNAIAPSTYEQELEDYHYNLKLRDATIASNNVEQRVRATQLTGQPAGDQADIANAGVDALTIRAPMDGQLTALDAEVGESKAQGAVLGQVNSADRFKLTALVDEFYLGHMSLGLESQLTLDGRIFRAKVAKVYPQVSNGTFKVDLHFNGAAPSDIHVGQAVDLKIELGGASQSVILANGPFYQDTGGNWAFVVSPDGGHAERRNVRLGRRNPDAVEVVDGLKPGEKVIVSGYEGFQKMDRVEFETAAANQ
jgi:HlyD family secretion protein